MKKITPFLWLESGADEAAKFYTSIFKDSEVLGTMAGPGGIMSTTIRIHEQELILFNGGPHFKLNEAASLFVNCETQDEIDSLWNKLSEGGNTSRCGWLQDKYGLWWQIIPSILGELLQHPDRAKADRAMQAMLKMDKLNIAELKHSIQEAEV
jgi:predicted 3-demethylubiquinone-9 3-methyltransferase (glyoxalase superfamily)